MALANPAAHGRLLTVDSTGHRLEHPRPVVEQADLGLDRVLLDDLR